MLRIVRKLGRADGAEIAEAALVLPLVFMFLLGIVWFGRAFNIYSTITQAAERGAVTAARPACATCTPGGATWPGTNFPGDAAVDSAVLAVMQASSLNPSQISASSVSATACLSPPAPPNGGCAPSSSGSNITICRSVVLNPSGTVPQCGTIVSFEYPFQMNFPFTSLNMQQIVMKAQAQSRMEN